MYYDPIAYHYFLSFLSKPEEQSCDILQAQQLLLHAFAAFCKASDIGYFHEPMVLYLRSSSGNCSKYIQTDSAQVLAQVQEYMKGLTQSGFSIWIQNCKQIPNRFLTNKKADLKVNQYIKKALDRSGSNADQSQAEIRELLSCFNENLEGMVFPQGWASDGSLSIRYTCSTCVHQSSPFIQHTLCLQLPRRYCMQNQLISEMQNQFNDLASKHDFLIASINMDVSVSQVVRMRNRNVIGTDNFSDSISGVSWQMWLTLNHKRKLLDSGWHKEDSSLYMVRDLPNHGLFAQMTQSIDAVSKSDNENVYQVLSPIIQCQGKNWLVVPCSLRDSLEKACIDVHKQGFGIIQSS